MDTMIDAFSGYGEAKDEKDTVCDQAFEAYTKTLKVGDDDPPSQKALEKVAKALAEEKVSKLTADLNDVTNALAMAKKNDDQGELFDR